MRLVDARRLMGPNLLARSRLVMAQVAFDPGEAMASVRALYLAELARMRAAVGLPPEVELLTREHRGGAVFAYPSPIDVMLVDAEISEWAAGSAAERSAGRSPAELEPKRGEIAGLLAAERRPRLRALAREAEARGLPLLWDDGGISVGAGARSSPVFPRDGVPAVEDVAWGDLGSIPIALVTGTNGKTTSTRLLARMAQVGGRAVGAASSGGLTFGGALADEGDYTGPGAARQVLRRNDVDLAVLETARGGILRRGLAMDACDVTLRTNVAADHIGLHGIDDLDAMTDVKAVVARAVRAGGTVVLGAADPRLLGLAARLPGTVSVVLFADLDRADRAGHEGAARARAAIDAHLARGGRAFVAEDGIVSARRGPPGGSAERVAAVSAIPITFGGAARHNVENVLGAAAAADALGIPLAAIGEAAVGFAMEDNPGRGQVIDHRGITVVLDYAHNPEGVRAVMDLVVALRDAGTARAGRPVGLTVVSGSPGDRSDHELAGLARAVAAVSPERVYLRELADYLRGRAPGEVPAILRRELLAAGLAPSSVEDAESEPHALEMAFAGARPGDVVAVLVHVEHAAVRDFLRSSSRPPT